jgi:hypothetical protein
VRVPHAVAIYRIALSLAEIAKPTRVAVVVGRQ